MKALMVGHKRRNKKMKVTNSNERTVGRKKEFGE